MRFLDDVADAFREMGEGPLEHLSLEQAMDAAVTILRPELLDGNYVSYKAWQAVREWPSVEELQDVIRAGLAARRLMRGEQ